MRLASWNVNSLRVRLPQVLEWLGKEQPDVLALQETKLTDDVFPADELSAAGYQSVFSGQKTYNGVAILTRGNTATEVVTEIADLEDPQRRIIAATIGGVRIYNVYVPNGQSVGSDKFDYKLRWLEALHEQLQGELERHRALAVTGDFNIAPEDRDVHDPAAWAGQVLVSEPERAALQQLMSLGFRDTFRLFEQPEASFSWWDYRAAAFRRNRGLRIDLVLASPALADTCVASCIDKIPRGWERPSDHTPVIATFDLDRIFV
ncbi:MAG: exodeoxyribonuclease III [Gammaproteobacteria bacterium]|nr:MAG: exodeoxyribonuclease III [Gammaproteobacteria bacterium]